MSTEHHNAGPTDFRLPLHDDVSFETKDVQTKPILRFLFFLAIAVVLSYGVTWVIYRGLVHYWAGTYDTPMPSRTSSEPILPPEPRLQGMPGHPNDPQLDWREKLKEDTAANSKFGWVNEQEGIAQIPVKDAMKLIVEKGLPAVTPPSAEKKQSK